MLLYHFRTPATKSVRFEKFHNNSSLAPECQVALHEASEARDKMVTILEQCFDAEATNPELLLTMLKEYIPHLLKMNQEVSTFDERSQRSFRFHWTSTILTDAKTFFTVNHFVDELSYTLFLYGMTHYQLAQSMHKDLPEDDGKENTEGLKNIVGHLKTAAGVFQWLEEYLNNKSRSPDLPIDTWPGTCQGMAMLCLTNAQEFSIQVAIRRGTGWGLVAKLSLGVAEKFREIQKSLGNTLHGKYHTIILNFREYCLQKSQIYSALSRLYLARNANRNGDYGDCVGFYVSAKSILDRMRFPALDSPSLDDVKKDRRKHQIVVNREYAEAKKDNDTVYYQSVTKKEDLEIPETKFIVKAEAFVMKKSGLSYFLKEDEEEL